MSPILFNLVMERLVGINFERGVKLMCYAGNRKHDTAQRAVHLIERKCSELGLKINPLKTKAMGIKGRRIPREQLTISGRDIGLLFVSV